MIVPGGYDDPDGLAKALVGVERVFLMSTPDLPEMRISRHRNAIEATARAGVDHVVFLSLHDAVPDSPFPFGAANHDAEVRLQHAGPAWTILAPNIYAEAIPAQAARTVAVSGVLDLPFGAGRAGYVTRADIAAVVAAVMTGTGHQHARYEITGPAVHSGSEIAAMLTELLERPVEYRPLSESAYVAGLVRMGLPEQTARAFYGLSSAIAQDRFAVVTTTVLDLTGRPATSLAQHLASAREVFAAT